MKNQLDQHQVLRVFDKVRQHGTHSPAGHQLDGLQAYTDFDGYTAFLALGDVTLTMGFHNKYQFDYPNDQQLERFMDKINQVDASY